jgi:Protein of unknown function (DUF2905)
VGRWLVVIGLLCVAAGLVAMLGERFGIKLGSLPGDIVIRRKNGAFYFPVVTCLIVSVLLSLISWLFTRR